MQHYRVKVRADGVVQKTYLFGGEKIARPARVNCGLLIRVDLNGEPVEISYSSEPGNSLRVGVLERGEAYIVGLGSVTGVWATAKNDTLVDCYIVPNATT